jgi:hypothetical protein
MSNRRAQDERIEGTPDGSNAITEIVDVPDAPTIGTATAGLFGASVPFTAATTGGTPSLYTATSTPGSLTGTSATSPITVSGLTGGTAYTFTVTPSNLTGTGPASSSSNSITPADLINGYDALADITIGTAVSSVTFSGIPAGYQTLELRSLARSTGNGDALVTLNGTSAARRHVLYGSGTGSGDAGSAADGYVLTTTGSSAVAGNFGPNILQIIDYADTNKTKVIRSLGGNDNNGSGNVVFTSGLWTTTDALTSITLTAATGNWAVYTHFALYGIK